MKLLNIFTEHEDCVMGLINSEKTIISGCDSGELI